MKKSGKITNRTGAYIIAEAGVNHNGSMQMALQLIDVAKRAGADAVKFQSFKTENCISVNASKAEYQKATTGSKETQWEMVKKLELDHQAHRTLVAHCRKKGIEFLSTPFDIESVHLLADEIGVSLLKIPSGELTNAPLVLAAARTGLPIILSTGMSTLGEIREVLGVIAFGYSSPKKEKAGIKAFRKAYDSRAGKNSLKRNVALLHCTTEYPTPSHDINLRAMATLKKTFGFPVGFSDHSVGIAAPIAAAALGARIIEKHFTLDKTLEGPDHRASLEPDELKAMVDGIRFAEAALGLAKKGVASSEKKNIGIMRKSLVAARDIAKGETLTPQNLTTKRPGTGISPYRYWELLGKKVKRAYLKDDLITL